MKPNLLKICPLQIADYANYVRFLEILDRYHYETFPNDFVPASIPSQTPAQLRVRLDDPLRKLYIAVYEHAICGYVDAKIADKPRNRHEQPRRSIHIHHLAVDHGYRGKGVAKALVAAVEDWARQEAIEILTLTVFEGNDEAIGLYESLGYSSFVRDMRKNLNSKSQ